MSVFFTDQEITNFETAKTANNPIFNRFYHHLLQNGIYLPPSSFETWFISDSIQSEEIDKTLSAVASFEG